MNPNDPPIAAQLAADLGAAIPIPIVPGDIPDQFSAIPVDPASEIDPDLPPPLPPDFNPLDVPPEQAIHGSEAMLAATPGQQPAALPRLPSLSAYRAEPLMPGQTLRPDEIPPQIRQAQEIIEQQRAQAIAGASATGVLPLVTGEMPMPPTVDPNFVQPTVTAPAVMEATFPQEVPGVANAVPFPAQVAAVVQPPPAIRSEAQTKQFAARNERTNIVNFLYQKGDSIRRMLEESSHLGVADRAAWNVRAAVYHELIGELQGHPVDKRPRR